jgi:hypothetical protein
MVEVVSQLVGNRGVQALRDAIREPDRYILEPKVDGCRALVSFLPDGRIETRNRAGLARQWLHGQPLHRSLERLGRALPTFYNGTTLDGEVIPGNQFITEAGQTSAIQQYGFADVLSIEQILDDLRVLGHRRVARARGAVAALVE